MKLDWLQKLSHLLQVLAFCLAVAAIQFAFQPERPYEIPLVYSLAIGVITWLVVDIGRHAWPSAQETGWPTGWAALALPIVGIVSGYVGGTLLADAWFGWSSWDAGGRGTLRASLIITVLAGISGSYFFYTRGKSAWLERKVTEAHYLAAEQKLKLLQTQLEPHMLFNTLANLRALIGADPARAQLMLDRLIAYLRATLDASRASSHSLQEEFDRLRDYLELMAVRMGSRLRYSLELPESLRTVPVPTLLLQPLVENAIKHGLEPKVDGGHIAVSAHPKGAELVLQVTDTGVGMETLQTTQASGFGLRQVRERLASAFDGRGQIEVTSAPGAGTVIRIHLPLTTPIS